jgi:hypothetical protein
VQGKWQCGWQPLQPNRARSPEPQNDFRPPTASFEAAASITPTVAEWHLRPVSIRRLPQNQRPRCTTAGSARQRSLKNLVENGRATLLIASRWLPVAPNIRCTLGIGLRAVDEWEAACR